MEVCCSQEDKIGELLSHKERITAIATSLDGRYVVDD